MSVPILRESADTVRLFDPATGEELDLPNTTTDVLAELRWQIREQEEDLRLAKQRLDAELVSRMDREARWSATIGGYKLSAPSPAPTREYDAKALRAALESLETEGLLSMAAVEKAVERAVVYRAHSGGLNAIRKIGGRVAAAIEEHSFEVEKPRRVSVRRA